ncbi:uncharacterized protein H6S33_009543 [Morchella sextelata]|uniref:uncharacterized protein n=1 Tax=Morchella sextelata TaxID=1174677 RepID=UPI001D04F1F0|nr:uncharacterized protein H6S33_009543 [Morchella sextelata]KAH0613163.1 hypothetical protein H6S33_009543 [Morchella sextelata]
MGRPIWREPTEKRTADAALEPRREAVVRRSAGIRPRVRGSDRSSGTLFNLLRSDYALENLSTGPARWSDNASLLAAQRGGGRRGLGRSEPLRPQLSRSVATGEEVYTPWFPPAGDRELAMQRREEMERIREDNERRRLLERLDREREREHERVARLTEEFIPDDMSWFGLPLSARQRYVASLIDEGRRPEPSSNATREIHLPRFDIDGLGDRERSLSPDANQWELMAELGFPGCEQDSEDSEDDEHNLMDALGTLEGEVERDRSEMDRLRRVANMFAAHNRDIDRLVERL